jgi:hypothetical protein
MTIFTVRGYMAINDDLFLQVPGNQHTTNHEPADCIRNLRCYGVSCQSLITTI